MTATKTAKNGPQRTPPATDAEALLAAAEASGAARGASKSRGRRSRRDRAYDAGIRRLSDASRVGGLGDLVQLSVAEAAAVLDVSPDLLYRLVSAGQLAAVAWSGRTIRLRARDLLEFQGQRVTLSKEMT